MGKFADLTGQRFGRLTVVARVENYKDGHARWICKCDCGKTTTVFSMLLTQGKTQSCGCLAAEMASKRAAVRNTTHGKTDTRLHCIWHGMKARCLNPKASYYYRYGGRGITVCVEWLNDFETFYNWAMSHGYRSDLTIDRIDNDKGYSPDNCRWATLIEQGRGKSTNRLFSIGGTEKTLAEWCQIYSKKRVTVQSRVDRGWPIEEALELNARSK